MGVNAMPEKMFPSAVLDWTAITLTYSELAIMWFIEQITNKPDWHVKVFNDDIAAKWKAEVMAVDWASVGLKYAHFDDDMFEWVRLMPHPPTQQDRPADIILVSRGAPTKGQAVRSHRDHSGL